MACPLWLLYSRALHVEILDDLSTDAFINGLRCFIALRGSVRQIKCDQGTIFAGAKNEMHVALQEVDAEKLATFLTEKQCDFVLNTSHANHAGGVWERQIRTVRNVHSHSPLVNLMTLPRRPFGMRLQQPG